MKKIVDLNPKVEKVSICPCGHKFNLHNVKGCYGLEKDGAICLCAFDEIEAKARAYEIQLDEVLEVLNRR